MPDKLYICGECKLAFPTREKYEEHTHIDFRNNNPFQCEYCKEVFTNINLLFDHMLRVHKKGPMDEKKMVSSGNLFLNVLAFQVYSMMTSFQSVLSELAEIKVEVGKNSKNEEDNQHQGGEVKSLIKNID